MTLALGAAACNDPSALGPDRGPGPTIAERISADPGFSTFFSALEAANLAGPLNDANGTFTVFAPGNAAFAALEIDALLADPVALEAVLSSHVITGVAFRAGELEDGQTLTSIGGTELSVRVVGGDVFIDGARIVFANVEAENGVIHLINQPLTGSRNVAGVVTLLSRTQALLDAVATAGLVEAFAEADQWTVFAPDNAAFEAAADVAAELTVAELQEVLRYHVLAGGAVRSARLVELLTENGGELVLPTAQGEDLTITLVNPVTIEFNGGQARLNMANVDFFASNGIVHLTSGVLLPPSFGAGG